MTAMMPCQWPMDSRSEKTERLLHPTQTSTMGEKTQQTQRLLPYALSIPLPRSFGLGIQTPPSRPMVPSPSSAPDELFFDCLSSTQAPTILHDEGRDLTSYLIFEPVVEDESKLQTTDWWRYDPPQELLHSQDGTSRDLERLLGWSIERIRARHLEEEESSAAAARKEQPLGRGAKASARPSLRVREVQPNVAFQLTKLSDFNEWSVRHHSSYSALKIDWLQSGIFTVECHRLRTIA
jgi:hypothetical protein